MARQSVGILVYRFKNHDLQVLLVHPGGPFWARKDTAAWSIPKGELGEDEEPLQAARREVYEETGLLIRETPMDLGVLTQSGGKKVHAFAVEGDFDPQNLASNTFQMHWPPGSSQIKSFPEVDRAAWFPIQTARIKIHKGQVEFLDRLCAQLGVPCPE
ncbi:MAG: NUDIX domain-containing protein [Desulfovermiculus sp.]